MSKLKEYIQKQFALQNKKRLTGEDEVDVFEVGPGTNPFTGEDKAIEPTIIVDKDPIYGGIQREEDDVFGDQTSRNITGFTSALLQDIVPKEKELDLEQQRAQQQAIYDQLLQVTGLEADSFEGQRLLALLKGNKEFAEKMGFNRDIGTTDSPRYGLFDFANLILGSARDGLTTMTETGASVKDLPFDQKLGIFLLPIDALDVVGVGALATGGLKSILKAGVKKYGKGSKLTLKNIIDDKELMDDVIKNNPEVEDFLQEFGFDSVGAARTPKNLLEANKPPDPKDRIGDIPSAQPKSIGIGQGEVDDALARANLEAQALKKETDKFKQVDPSLKKAAKEADKNVQDFSAKYEKAYGNKKNRVKAVNQLRKDIGAKEFDRLEKLAIQKGLSKQRNLPPPGTVKITTPEGDKFIKKNGAKLSATELKLAMTQDEDTIKKFFHTDGQGNPMIPKDSYFRQYPATLGVKREGGVGQKGGKARREQGADADKKIFDQFEIFTSEEGFNMNDPAAVREAFAKAFVSDASGSKFSGFDINSKNKNFRRALSRKIVDYNKSKGFGDFDKTKGYEEGRIYNRDQIQQINRYLSVGKDSEDKSSMTAKFESYLTNNDIFNTLKNNMKPLDDSFYPVVDGTVKRYFSTKIKRYLNFIRETSADTRNPVQGSFDPFMDKFGNDIMALLDPSSIEYQNFLKFSYHDKIREEVGELSKPVLNKIFKAPEKRPDGSTRTEQERIDEARNSIQIAHTFESSQVGETLGEGLTGAGMIPGSYYLDLSRYNAIQQPRLEQKARAAVDEFEATGDRSKLDEVDMQLEKIGAEVAIGDYILGRHKTLAEKLTDIIGGPPGSKQRELLKKQYGVTDEEIAQLEQAIDLLNEAGFRTGKVTAMQSGGLVQDVDDIFEEEKNLLQPRPRITIDFGDAAMGTKRSFGEEKPEEQVFDIEQKTTAAPTQKTIDVQPTENIFTGEVQQANLKFPFYKLFTKPPVNETAPIPTPKESLDNPTKKQKESLELEKEKKKDEAPYDPTPDDDVPLTDDVLGMDIAVAPKSQTPITGVFYSDIERLLSRPDTPAIFVNKKALLDFFKKNRIRDSEFRDYQINSLLKAYDENTPIPKDQVINHLRQSPIRGMHVHATGEGSEIINPDGAVSTQFTGYAANGFLPGSQRERVLYIPNKNIAGDIGTYPQTIFKGEKIENHKWGMRNQDDVYVVGWTRLSDRMAILPTKLEAPKLASKVPGLTRERQRIQRQVAGLYAEAINKLNREAVRRGMSQDDINFINQLSLEQMMSDYGGTLEQISPGLLDQLDELIVKVRDIDADINKSSTPDTSGIVKVTFADEIQSDIMQAAAGRKQKLLATLKRIRDEGADSSTLPNLDKVGNDALAFFEENKSVFRPLLKSEAELEVIGQRLSKVDAEIDEIINRYIETREIDDEVIDRLQKTLETNINDMIEQLITVDNKTYDGLFPDLPFKKREEWADALIKKDLFELAYRKFILKDPNVADYYAVSPEDLVLQRYTFKGNSATPLDIRAADKKRQIDYFMARGEFTDSEYKGVGMSEFYGGPNAKDPSGKHYTSTLEKILKTQAKQNNSEFVVLNVQTKEGSKDVYRITDQSGNMVATLSNRQQAERVADQKSTTPSFAIKITEEMLEPYKTHKAKGGLVSIIDIFEVN